MPGWAQEEHENIDARVYFAAFKVHDPIKQDRKAIDFLGIDPAETSHSRVKVSSGGVNSVVHN